MALYVLGDYAAALPEAQAGRICCAGFGPALLAAVEGQRGEAKAAGEALQEAIARSPLLARDPRVLCALSEAVDLFAAGLEKAGLNTAEARAAAGSAEKL
jgi:hypothetical protein